MSGKIINYRKTCDYLEHFLVCGYHEAAFGGKVGCDIGDHSFKPCCSDYGKNQVDYVPILNNDVSFAFDRYLIKRDDLLQKLHNDEMCCCTGCPFVYFSNQPVDNKFFYIIFNEIGRCNCKCVYCNYQVRLGRNVSSDVDIIELYDLIKEKGYLCKESTIELCNGEITIFPEKKRIYDHLKDCHIMFLTNGIIYDEEIARRMQQGTATLNVSIDAGTKETFLAVKGVDAFECVVNNLKLYSKNRKGNFNLKYILLPGINDNCEDIDGFVELCRKLNVSAAHISYNLCLDFEDYNNEKMISAITRLIRKLDEYKIEYEIYSEELKKILKI